MGKEERGDNREVGKREREREERGTKRRGGRKTTVLRNGKGKEEKMESYKEKVTGKGGA